MITITESKNFLGKTIVLSNGKLDVTVTTDVGPRIIGLRLTDGQNVMFEDVHDEINKDCSQIYGENQRWHIYGGHRLWLSPEDLTTYYPDNSPVQWELMNNGLRLYPPQWKIVDVQPILEITFTGDNELTVNHRLKNLGATRPLCIWALTVMKSGGVLTYDFSDEDTGFLANRNLVLWPYASLHDPRFALTDNQAVLSSSQDICSPFKFGGYKKDLKVDYVLSDGDKKVLFTKRIDGGDSALYPDFCCNFESYCTHLIHEVETLSERKAVANGEELVHTECWSLTRL